MSDDQGWALVSVLYVVAMLGLMAAAVQALLLSSEAMNRKVWEHTQAAAVLDAAVVRAVVGIGDGRLDQRWRVDGATMPFRFGGIDVAVEVQDQLGLIDLNAADGSLLKQLLQSAGLSDTDAATLTDRILDWRSPADQKRLHGASNAEYATAGLSYHPRHGPFQSVSELRLVLGISNALYARLAPALTVYNGRPAFDPNTAPATALRALYLNSPDQVARLIAERQQSADALGSRPGVLSPAISLAGRAFAISAKAKLGAKRYRREAVVLLTGDETRPYLVLAWQ